MAGTIVVSDIRSDNDNTITFTSNTGETIFTANLSSGIDATYLANTGVTAAVYGGASQIPVVTVDEKGRITSAANVSVSIPSFDSPLNIVADDTGGAEIRLPEDTDNGVNFVALKANSSIASNVTFVLPNADGTSNQVLRTDGSGNLSFITVGSVGSANISAGDSNVTVVDSGTGRVEMNVDGSTRAIFNEYGLGLGPNVPSSGIGIRFPASQSASSDANTLDDYEEGTWTPTLKTTSTNFSSITYSSQIGDYVKIGSYIYCQFFVQIASVSGGSGDIQLTGLPFASSGAGRPNSGGYVQLVNGWTTNNPSNFDASGASSLDYNIQYRATSNGVTVALPVAAATATAYMRGTILIKL